MKNIFVLFHSESESSYTLVQEERENSNLLPPDSIEITRFEAKSFEIACMKRNEFLGWEPYKPQIDSIEDLKNLIPVDKHDLDNAKLLINLGYPKVKPILYDIIDWIGDINWPVAKIFLPFLSSIGKECNDVIQKIFESNDGMLKYNVIQYVIPNMKKEDSKFFIPILKKLQKNLTEDDKKEEVDLAILEAIEEIESL